VVGRVHGEQVGGGEVGAGVAGRVGGRAVSGPVLGCGTEALVAQDGGGGGVAGGGPGAEWAADEAALAQVGVEGVRVALGQGAHQPGDRIAAPLEDAHHGGLDDAVHDVLSEAHVYSPFADSHTIGI
jgi:hypothetical protein